jgi:hypothetical protein
MNFQVAVQNILGGSDGSVGGMTHETSNESKSLIQLD